MPELFIVPSPAPSSLRPPETVRLLGLNLSRMTYQETIRWLDTNILKTPGQRVCVLSANADQTVRCHTEPEFREIYEEAGLIVPDGMPLVWAARLLGKPLPERVTGIDLMHGLCELAARNGYPCFLLGSRPPVLTAAIQNLHARFPGLAICGSHSGYFQNDDVVVKAINAARPAILFVGMGSPRQEAWLKRNFSLLRCQLALPVGGAFDVVAGRLRRAPVVLQKLGLEWFWRMLHEPRRLWRRYLLDDTKLVAIFLRELRSRRGPRT
jgi:N-acetylglucosaminyldiphosphoundecaprenol N-acetyl-beta-D-mannosaminyltransferase